MKFGRNFLFVYMQVIVIIMLVGCSNLGIFERRIVETPLPVQAIDPPDGVLANIIIDQSNPQAVEVLLATNIDTPIEASQGLDFWGAFRPYYAQLMPIAPYEFQTHVSISTKGWDDHNSDIDVTITRPDGYIEKMKAVATNYGQDDVPVGTGLLVEGLDSIGTYRFEFTGEDKVFVAEQEVVLPDSPSIYIFPIGNLWLYGFEPNETVELLRYDVSDRVWLDSNTGGGHSETFTLVAYQIESVAEDGSLSLIGFSANTPNALSESYIFAIGEQSGEILPFNMAPAFQTSILSDK